MEEGCNHIKCPKCGTEMCYVCKGQIKGYSHFDLENPGRCPMSSDTKRLHYVEVATASAEAREDLAAQQPGLRLRHYPTVDIALPTGPLAALPTGRVYQVVQ